MKVCRELGNGLVFEASGDNHVTLFESLSEIDKGFMEVFGPEDCGHCGNRDTRFRTRTTEKEVTEGGKKKTKKYIFHERYCPNFKCRAVLSYGEHQEGGTLFPKRKKEGTEEWDNEHRGWRKFTSKQDAAPASADAPKEKAETKKNDKDNPF